VSFDKLRMTMYIALKPKAGKDTLLEVNSILSVAHYSMGTGSA